MKRFIAFALVLVCVMSFALPARAQETEYAEELTSSALVTDMAGFGKGLWMFDGRLDNSEVSSKNARLTLESPIGIGSLYIIFDIECGPFTVTNEDDGNSVRCGDNQFLHQFLDMEELFGMCPSSVSLQFGNENIRVNELEVFGPGEPPDHVQRWKEAPEGGVDLMLFSAHGDDEQLFMGGVLPYYAGEMGYEVLVSYMTAHRNFGNVRAHEMLDGLWAVGVTNYPIFGKLNDYPSRSMNATYSGYAGRGISEEDIIAPVVEQLRKYHPQVVVTHDVNGEYGHGMHMAWSDAVQKAVNASSDPGQYKDSVGEYGTWDVPKTYLHLYPEGEIVMDWDRPLEHFGGMTAYEVTKEKGFPAHASQYYDFAWFMDGYDKAIDIPKFNPCYYGLYRSTVGEDVEKNDFFEHLTSYAEQARLAEEQAQRDMEQELADAQAEAAKAKEEAEQARREAEAARQEAAEARKEQTAPAETVEPAVPVTETPTTEAAEPTQASETTQVPTTQPEQETAQSLDPAVIRLAVAGAVFLVLFIVLIGVIGKRKKKK